MSRSISDALALSLASIFNCAPVALSVEPDDAESLLQDAIDAMPESAVAQTTQPENVEPPARKYTGRRRKGTFNPNWRKVTEITVEVNPRTGNLEIRFPNKPAEAVLKTLRDQKWRWNPVDGAWYGPNSTANQTFTQSLKSYASMSPSTVFAN